MTLSRYRHVGYVRGTGFGGTGGERMARGLVLSMLCLRCKLDLHSRCVTGT